MAAYFSVILKCAIASIDDERIRNIEQTSPIPVQRVRGIWLAKSLSSDIFDHEGWISTEEVIPESIPRPQSLSPVVALRTAECFYIRFGTGAVEVSHNLRWATFVRDYDWRDAMLAASSAFAEHFDATDGIVLNDDSPISHRILSGSSFDDALRECAGTDDEVASIDELYTVIDDIGTWESKGYWRLFRYEDGLRTFFKDNSLK